MENYYLNLLLQPSDVTGNEAFGIPKFLTPVEGFRMRFSNLSLELDKKIASMSSSVHVVKYDAAQRRSASLSYIDMAKKQLAVPVHFDPRKMKWEDYIKSCYGAVSLVDAFKTDSGRFYDWMKEIAAKGKVSGTFRYTISSTSAQIDRVESFIQSLGNNKKDLTQPLKTLYPSFNVMFKTINDFNVNVSMIKARDAEIIARQLKLNAELGELVLQRIISNDIVLNESDVEIIKRVFDDFERYMNLTGALVGLLNETSSVLQDQCNVLAD
ncbi:hypothetical protein [Vibrio phage phiKT1028]|nr:hypothetical protein [Vibrio phage phiKT1028]